MKVLVHFKRILGLTLVLGLLHAALAPLHAQDLGEVILQLDRLEAENRRLTGQIEEMRFQNRRLEDQLKRFQTDSDLRFRDLEAARGGAKSPPPIATPAPQSLSQKRPDAFDPQTNPGAPGTPRPLATETATPTTPRPVQNAEVSVPGNPKTDYNFARSLVERGDYELAEGALRDFLKHYPKDRLVPDATFFLGESYLNRTRYREAAEHYLTVTSTYTNATRAPEAMLKLGISLRGLGAKQEACGTFEQLPKKYPKASPEIRQALEREKGRSQC